VRVCYHTRRQKPDELNIIIYFVIFGVIVSFQKSGQGQIQNWYLKVEILYSAQEI
jgi:hypothetical protein